MRFLRIRHVNLWGICNLRANAEVPKLVWRIKLISVRVRVDRRENLKQASRCSTFLCTLLISTLELHISSVKTGGLIRFGKSSSGLCAQEPALQAQKSKDCVMLLPRKLCAPVGLG